MAKEKAINNAAESIESAEALEQRLELIQDKLSERMESDRQKVGMYLDILKNTDNAKSIRDLSIQSEKILRKLEAVVAETMPKKAQAGAPEIVPPVTDKTGKVAPVELSEETNFLGTADLRQSEQEYVQELWETRKKEEEVKKQLETSVKRSAERKFITPEGEVGAEQVRFTNKIPDALAGNIQLEITRKPSREVGSNTLTGELRLELSETPGQEKLFIMAGDKQLDVKEVYKNLDGSWTIDAGAYEYRTEGFIPEAPKPTEEKPSEATANPMVEAAQANMTGVEVAELPDTAAAMDLRTRINVAKMKMDGMSDSEIEKNLALLSIDNLKKNEAVSSAIESLGAKIAAGESIEAELKVLADQAAIPEVQISSLRETAQAIMAMEAQMRMPSGSKTASALKFAGYFGLGAIAATTGPLAIGGMVLVRALDSVLAKKKNASEYQTALAEANAELSDPNSGLRKKMSQELVSRLAGIKQEQINNTNEALASLPADYLAIKEAKNQSERENLIADNEAKLERLGDQVYLQAYEYYKANRGHELNEKQLEALAKDAKFKFIQEERAKRSKVMNSVVNRTFDERVDGLVDSTVPTFRDALKGAGLTENQSQWHSGAVTLGMGAAMRSLSGLATMQAGAFLAGGATGEYVGKKLFGKELNIIKIEDVQKMEKDPSEEQIISILGKLDSQLNDDNFKAKHPDQHRQLQAWIDNFDQQALGKIENDEDRKAYIADRGTGIKKWLAREKDQKDKIALTRWLGRLLLVGAATAMHDSQPQAQEKPHPTTEKPVAAIEFPRLEGKIEATQGISQQLEDMINKGLDSGQINEQNAQHFIDQSQLALEHAHQTGAISDETFNAIAERLSNSANLHDKLMASVDAWGVDHRDFDMQKVGDRVAINLESGTVEFVNRGDLPPAPVETLQPFEREANEVGLPPETAPHEVAYHQGRAAEIDKKIAELEQAKYEFPEDQRGKFDEEIAKLEADKRNPPALNIFSEEQVQEANLYRQLFDDFNKLSADTKIEISAKPGVLEELSKRGFHTQTSSGTPEFIAGNHHFQISEGVEKVEFTQEGKVINMIQTTKDKIVTVPIGPDNVAGTAKIEDRGFLNKLFS